MMSFSDRAKSLATQKIKKVDGPPELRLVPTTDILTELGQQRNENQVLVGFAAETTELRQNATAKLVAKGVDLIVANDVSAPSVGFGYDTNAVLILDADGGVTEVPLSDKREVARVVIDVALESRRLVPNTERSEDEDSR